MQCALHVPVMAPSFDGMTLMGSVYIYLCSNE